MESEMVVSGAIIDSWVETSGVSDDIRACASGRSQGAAKGHGNR